ncbi:MAG: VWA domain-containing protein [Deltaproteobacteria bacterium]|nr:VWA domain-containing protein [Deltaproteobacteria bacterium]
MTPAVHINDTVELKLRQVFATIVNVRGQRILGLVPKDFELRDNGRKQRIVTLASGDIPFSAVLLLDGSLSMRGSPMEAAIQGVRSFVEGMNPFDEARLLVFSDRLLAASPFTGSPDELLAEVPSQRVETGTSIHDHLFWSIRLLEGKLGRKVLVLLSDGQDVHSVLRMEVVAEALSHSEAQLYWVQILDAQGLARSRARGLHSFLSAEEILQQRDLLRRAVQRSGGRVLEVRQPEEIPQALAEVLRELREQYAIGYYPEPGIEDGSWHRLDVKVQGLGRRVQVREGYFAPSQMGGDR